MAVIITVARFAAASLAFRPGRRWRVARTSEVSQAPRMGFLKRLATGF